MEAPREEQGFTPKEREREGRRMNESRPALMHVCMHMEVLADMVRAGGRRYQVLKTSKKQMMILLNRKKILVFLTSFLFKHNHLI